MIRFLIERPVSVYLITIALVLLSAWSLDKIPVSLLPRSDIPEIIVVVDDPSLPAGITERDIITPMRNELAFVRGLKEIRSETTDRGGKIILRMTHGSDKGQAAVEVNERIDRVMKSLPRDFGRPRIIQTSPEDIAMLYVNVFLASGSDSLLWADLASYVERIVWKRIEQLPAVSFSEMAGAGRNHININLDPDRMLSRGLSANEILDALKNPDRERISLGFARGNYICKAGIDIPGIRPSELKDLPIAAPDGAIIRLKEVAGITRGVSDGSGTCFYGKRRCILLSVHQRPGESAANLREQVVGALEELKKDEPLIDYAISRDRTGTMKLALTGLRNSLVTGVFLAVIILFLVMRDLRSAFIISVSIPVAMVISVIGIYAFGLSFNIISISGLILAIGMMTDTSLIIIDNIRQHSLNRRFTGQAVIYGTSEVVRPLVTSALTTCAAFLPLILVSDTAGEFFREQALTVTIGLSASLLVGVFFIPVLQHSLRSEHINLKSHQDTLVIKAYERGIAKILVRPGRNAALFALLVPLSLLLLKVPEINTFPEWTRDEYFLYIEWDKSTTLSENALRTRKLIDSLPISGVQFTAISGIQPIILDRELPEDDNIALLIYRSASQDSLKRISEEVKRLAESGYPGTRTRLMPSRSLFDRIFREEDQLLTARVASSDKRDAELIESLIRWMQKENVGSGNDHHYVSYQQKYTPDIERLLFYDVPEELVETEINIREGGIAAGEMENQPIRLTMEGGDGRGKHLKSGFIRNRKGELIPLASLVRKIESAGPSRIISAGSGSVVEIPVAADGKNVRAMIDKIGRAGKELGLDVSFTGQYSESRKLLSEIVKSLIFSIVLLYFIIAAQFESLLQPLIIIFEILIDITGVLLIHIIFGESLNIVSGIGIIVMAGIIINDSILKVDTINRESRNGQSIINAIVTGGRRRFNPIVMTSLTTILALLPLLFTPGLGSVLQRPMALSVIGGLTVGTLASLFYIPVAYCCLVKARGMLSTSIVFIKERMFQRFG